MRLFGVLRMPVLLEGSCHCRAVKYTVEVSVCQRIIASAHLLLQGADVRTE